MGWISGALPVLWAQTQAQATAATSTTGNPTALAPLALRRWSSSLTLSSPESVPSLFGLWVWLAALGGLFALAVLFQGPARAFRQLVDLPGHARLAFDSARRLRKASRTLAAVVGLTVLSWTGSQSIAYSRAEGRDDVIQLTRARHLAELAVEQGVLAGLTPLRDVAGLGANLPLLVVATVLLFRAAADVWGGPERPKSGADSLGPGASGRANAGWTCGALLILYRLVSIGSGQTELPLGGCLMVEALVVPALLAVGDGLILAWLLAELRDAGSSSADPHGDALDARAAVGLLPASILACLVALPARYLAAAVLLASMYLPSSAGRTAVGAFVRWQLGHGLAEVQGAALVVAGLAGAAAWGSGGAREAVRGYARLLSSQGARLVVAFALSGLASGAAAAFAYIIVLSHPAAPWVLNAADSYAHYATLPIGLLLLSALVELGERSLPEASLAVEGGTGGVG